MKTYRRLKNRIVVMDSTPSKAAAIEVVDVPSHIKSYFLDELKDLMIKCLRYEPKSRPQAIKIIKILHPTSVIQQNNLLTKIIL